MKILIKFKQNLIFSLTDDFFFIDKKIDKMTDRLKIDSQNVLIQDGHSYADYIYNKQNVVRTGEDRYTLNNEHLRYTIKTDLKVPKSKQKRHNLHLETSFFRPTRKCLKIVWFYDWY